MQRIFPCRAVCGLLSLWVAQAFGADGPGNVPVAVSDTFWIDVRTPQEFTEGHLSGAYNIPLQEFAQTFADQVPDKKAVIALYCRSGNRSGQALALARSMGYSQAFNAGGYVPLKKARSGTAHP